MPGSPCIDTGDNYAPSVPKTDFDGLPRPVDGNADGIPIVDMGAFEFQGGETIPPTTTAAITPEPNAHGWNNSDVMVILTAVDNPGGSGVDHLNYVQDGTEHQMAGESAAISVTNEGSTTITYWAVDADGNAEEPKTLTVMIDKTFPTISFTRSPDPNGHGWNNSDVTVHFDAEDVGSGLASVSGDAVISQEGAGQSVIGTVTDLAGNTATVTVSGINIDKTPPEIVGSAETPPNSAGWYNTDVLVRFAIRDVLSGLPEPVQREFLLTAEGPNQSVTGTAMDLAGNSATDTVSGINIDKTPPTINYTISPPPNALGWNTSDVTVTFRADDALSGVESVSPPQTIITEGADQPVAGAARDMAGNSAQIGLVVSIDKSNPVVTISASPDILWPPNKKFIAVKILGSAADAISDIASITFTIKDEYGTCQPAVSGFGSIFKLEAWRDGDDMDGRHYIITVTVTDNAGRETTASTVVLVPHDEG